ncbi:hypothetical protein P4O66_001501 [Electrophorus voltai]|uniref:DUF4939 domain-containing protein n=1 Tax=Electrophorus voltai TaxID=2609070 RepID=A0AAD8Z653_9TELE|nr:hypothetical protein P4O66_001501 [Electrophorus voltai]
MLCQQPSHHTTRDTGLLPEAELGYMKTLLSMLKDGKPLVLPSLMATPSKYGGEDKSMGRFITQCRIYLQYLTCPKPPELVKVLFIKTFLRGKALPWAEIIFQHRAQEATMVEGFFRLLTGPVPVPGIVDAVAMNVPGRRDTTSPVPGARDAAHPCPGPVPGAREAARPDPVPAPGVRNAARPDPAPSARDATCPDQVLVPGTRDTAHPGPVPGLVVAACFCCQFCLGSCLWLQACSCEHSETRYPAMWHCYFLTCPSACIHACYVPCSCSYVGRT